MAKKKPEPLVILKDTREPRDVYLWKSEFWKGRVTMLRKKLDCGDYTAQGQEPGLVIERKTLADYVASITVGRDRFRAEWERCIPDAKKWLILEGEHVMTRLFEAEYESKTHEHSAIATLLNWQERFEYNVLPVPNSVVGEKAVVWIIKGFLKDQAAPTRVVTDKWDYLYQTAKATGKATDNDALLECLTQLTIAVNGVGGRRGKS